MEASLINMEDWVRFGEGANGSSYYHKTDDGIMLKLNKAELPSSESEKEYLHSRAVRQLGIASPTALSLVTDGTRYGIICEKINDKKSFARLVADNPNELEAIARDFARETRKLHQTECDTSQFQSIIDHYRYLISNCSTIPEDIRNQLMEDAEQLDGVTTCLHGDLHPGNMIRSGSNNYWIDMNSFGYGNPDIDMGTFLTVCTCSPRKVIEDLFHMSKRQFKRFFEVFGQEYYGELWHTKELEERLNRVLRLRYGTAIATRPKSAILFLPLLKGQKTKSAIIKLIADIAVRKYES